MSFPGRGSTTVCKKPLLGYFADLWKVLMKTSTEQDLEHYFFLGKYRYRYLGIMKTFLILISHLSRCWFLLELVKEHLLEHRGDEAQQQLVRFDGALTKKGYLLNVHLLPTFKIKIRHPSNPDTILGSKLWSNLKKITWNSDFRISTSTMKPFPFILTSQFLLKRQSNEIFDI